MSQEFIELLPKSSAAIRKWTLMDSLQKQLLDMALCHSLLAGYSKFVMLLQSPSSIKQDVLYELFTLEIDCAKFVFCGRTDKDTVVLVYFFIKETMLGCEYISKVLQFN